MLYGEREAQGQREVVRQPLAAFVAQHHCTQPLALLSAGGVQSLVDEHVVEPKLREVHLVRVDARGHGRAALRAHVVQRRVEQRLHRCILEALASCVHELFGKTLGVRAVDNNLQGGGDRQWPASMLLRLRTECGGRTHLLGRTRPERCSQREAGLPL